MESYVRYKIWLWRRGVRLFGSVVEGVFQAAGSLTGLYP